MDFFEKIGFPALNSGIKLERLKQEEGEFSLFIKDNDNQIIGCGIYDSSINEEELYTSNAWVITRRFFNTNRFKYFDENNCFFFQLADEHYYLLNTIHANNPTYKKQRDLSMLINEVKSKIKSNQEYELNQVKNQVTELNDKINEYENSIREKEVLIESLRENIKTLENYRRLSEDLMNEKKELTRLLNCEYTRNVITIDELRTYYNNLQIDRLVKKPFYFEETEILHQIRLGLKNATRSIIPNVLTEMCWNQNYNGSEIKLRVKYEHWRWYEEANNYAPHNKTHCFFINELGEIKHEEYWEQDDDKYVLIK